jgi:hypothetical protein
MKKILFVLMIISVPSFAQTDADLTAFLGEFQQSVLYTECQQFKTTVEVQAKALSNKINSAEQARQLQQVYINLGRKYDLFLKTIKKDLIGTQNINGLSGKLHSNESTYQNLLADVKNDYESHFLPIYQAHLGGKDITEDLLNMGVGLVKNLFQRIKAKKTEKKESLNVALSQINNQFYSQLRMKTWSELDVPRASFTESPNSQVIDIPTPTLGNMEGSIKFVQLLDGQELVMEFVQHTGKDIVVDEEKHTTYKTPYFSSASTFAVGTKFRIEAFADVFIYAIVLNSTGVRLLHPRVQYAQIGKDIEVTSDASPTVGKMVLPSKGTFTIVEDQNATGKTSEDFALVISKSELVMEETIEKLNASEGSLDERFSQVFGINQITLDEAQVHFADNQFRFSYQLPDKNILPLVFKILK